MIFFFLIALFWGVEAFSEEKYQAGIEPGIEIGAPLCKGYTGGNGNSAYKLCLPSSVLRGTKVSLSGNSILLIGPGAINGPVLVETKPQVILIGSMIIDKGGLDLSITKTGGFQMKGINGMFQVQGLVVPLSATKPLLVDEVELEFTSPEDAILQISASGQNAGVVLRVQNKGEGSFVFVPSPPSNSIFPDNPFFSVFEGDISRKRDELILRLKDGRKIQLNLVKQ